MGSKSESLACALRRSGVTDSGLNLKNPESVFSCFTAAHRFLF
ncbi:MAG: hypothetical protein P8X74_22265 [Reinekea sp.]